MNDLLYSIGLDVSDLKTSATAAKEQADEIKKGFKGFKDILEAGGVATAVYGFFSAVISYAKESKDALDPNIAAVKGFASGLASIKETAMSVGVTAVGAFNRMGEAIGESINILRKGWSAWADDQDKLEATAAAAAEAEARRDEVKKKHADDYKKITEGLLEVKKQEQALANQGITKQETLNNLTNDFLRIGIQLANGVEDTLTRRKLELELAQARLAMGKAELDVKKEDAQIAEKADKEAEKALDEQIKQFNALGEVKAKQLAYERSKLSVEEQSQLLTAEKYQLEKLLLDKNISMTKETETRNRLLEITKQLDEFAADNASERLATEEAITEEKQQQVEIISSGPGYQSQSTAALQGIRSRVSSNLDASIAADFGQGWGVGGKWTDPAIEQFRNQLAKIDAELSMRREVQNYAQRFGQDAAVRQYGDELTQRAFRDMADTGTKTADSLASIKQTLSRVFPNT